MVNNFLDFLKKRPEGDDGALFFNNWVQGSMCSPWDTHTKTKKYKQITRLNAFCLQYKAKSPVNGLKSFTVLMWSFFESSFGWNGEFGFTQSFSNGLLSSFF